MDRGADPGYGERPAAVWGSPHHASSSRRHRGTAAAAHARPQRRPLHPGAPPYLLLPERGFQEAGARRLRAAMQPPAGPALSPARAGALRGGAGGEGRRGGRPRRDM